MTAQTAVINQWTQGRLLRQGVVIVMGTLLLALSARVEIPFWPVPFTMQTFVVLALGLIYGPVLGVATMLAYLGQGLMGLPVFAAGGGPGYLAGPTGGYLLGMVAAMGIAGALGVRGWLANPVFAIAAAGLANAAVYVLGVAWLGVYLGSIEQAVTAGLLPFLPGAVLKIGSAGLIAWGVARMTR